jgi:hypothetical protein
MGRPSPIPISPGLRFGRLTVIEQAKSTSPSNPRWKCRCDCGKVTQPHAADLRRGTTKSCGCIAAKDMTGLRFGRLIVINRVGSTSSGQARWECRCDCGNSTQSHGADLRRGRTQSCGCLKRKIMRNRFAKDLAGQRYGRAKAA